jgi:hypothetical protein
VRITGEYWLTANTIFKFVIESKSQNLSQVSRYRRNGWDMNTVRRLVTFYNIEPREERLIGLLVLLAFTLELAFVFIQSMAFGRHQESVDRQPTSAPPYPNILDTS